MHPRGNLRSYWQLSIFKFIGLQVLEVIEAMVSKRKIMKNCRLLLSIDRRRSLDIAQETLNLYLKLRDESPLGYLLGGIDFSGDARANDAITFIPVMKKAQENGIRLAVHLAEIPNEKETCAFLGSTSNESGVNVILNSKLI